MALTRKGTLAFGIGTAGGGLTAPSGTSVGDMVAVSSAEATSENQVNSKAKDATGLVVAHAFGDPKNTLRVEGFNSVAAIPALGVDLTVGGKTGAVMRATVTASNEDFVKLSIEAEGYPGVTYT